MSDETPIPPQAPQPVTPRNVGRSAWAWVKASVAHEIVAASAAGLFIGYLLGKLL